MTSLIHKYMNDVALRLEYIPSPVNDKINHFLKGLETFLLCARKLREFSQLKFDGSDLNLEGSLGSLLSRIDVELSRNSRSIDDYRRGGCHHAVLIDLVHHFETVVKCFEVEIDQWYTTLSGSLHLLQWRSPAIEDVVEIIDSVLKNLECFHDSNFLGIGDATEAMEEKIKLLRNFICFVAMQNVEDQPLESFVIHVAGVAINAAHVTAQISSMFDVWNPKDWNQMKPNILALLQTIKPIDPHLFETYKSVLASVKFSRELRGTLSLDHDPIVIIKDFIDFLLWSFWETLHVDTCSVKDELQLQPLWQALKFLRAILEKHEDKFNAEIESLSGKMICDAGVIVFTLYQQHGDGEAELGRLLENFNKSWVQVEGLIAERLLNSVLGFLKSLSDGLIKMKSSEVDLDNESHMKEVRRNLKSVLDVMGELQNQTEDFKSFTSSVAQVAYRIVFLVDNLLGSVPDSFSRSLDSISEDNKMFKTDALEISEIRMQEMEDEKFSWISSQVGAPVTSEVVGFEDEMTSIINRLTGGSDKLQVIAIIGVPGSGKTTLTSKVFEDSTVVRHFHVRARCSVSQVYNRRKLLVELLGHIHIKLPDSYLLDSEDALADELSKSLKGHRYLILLDNVMDSKVWESLKGSFPDDDCQSRIILTSQQCDAAPPGEILDEKPHFLRHLTKDESWKLLQKRVFPDHDCPPELHHLGNQISDICKGLPLAIIMVAGLLNCPEPDVWKGVLESLSSDTRSPIEVIREGALWDHVAHVAQRMKILVDELEQRTIPHSFSTTLDSITKGVMILKAGALEIVHSRKREMDDEKAPKNSTLLPSQNSAPVATDEVVGLEEETKSIIDQLRNRLKKLQVVAIVGMAGLGKTTIAMKIYNHGAITSSFHVRASCSVSQVFNPKKTLLELLSQTKKGAPDRYLEMSEYELGQELWRSLKGCKYLILLDDVWDIQAWNRLKQFLPDDEKESRILMTTRDSDVAGIAMLAEKPHSLRYLSSNECWMLLQKKTLFSIDSSSKVCDIGKQIAENCKGLPLTVVIVSGLLSTLQQQDWEEVLRSLSSGDITREDQFINTLELSYQHLPVELKECFLYFGLFPEDEDVLVKQLIWLWMAEDLIKPEKESLREDLAKKYVNNLVGRSLLTVSKEGSTGEIKACRIHDLLRSFCITRAEEDNFSKVLRGYDEILAFNELSSLPRLCIHSKRKDFKNLKLFRPNIQSLLFFAHNESWRNVVHDISITILVFKCLRVLYIMQIDLGDVFPSKMDRLVELRYLAVKGCFTDIHPSIGKISNLETFVVDSACPVELPVTIWDLHKLRHLCIQNGFLVCNESLSSSLSFDALESCSTAIISSWDVCEKLMSKFPNSCRLKCRLFQDWDTENCNHIRIPESLSQLNSLHLSSLAGSLARGSPKDVQFKFDFRKFLTKLTLDHFVLCGSHISTIGKLPNLEVLKLLNVSFPKGVLDMPEDEFSNLKFFKLSNSKISEWTADDGLNNLKKVVLERCHYLQEIPSCLKMVPTLEMMEVLYCSQYVENFIKELHDEQRDYGNSDLKIFVSHSEFYVD